MRNGVDAFNFIAGLKINREMIYFTDNSHQVAAAAAAPTGNTNLSSFCFNWVVINFGGGDVSVALQIKSETETIFRW